MIFANKFWKPFFGRRHEIDFLRFIVISNFQSSLVATSDFDCFTGINFVEKARENLGTSLMEFQKLKWSFDFGKKGIFSIRVALNYLTFDENDEFCVLNPQIARD